MKARRIIVMMSMCVMALGCQAPAKGPPQELRLENLMKQVLSKEIARDREVIMTYVEIPPHTTMERHWHPGEEFHYYIDGEVRIEIDGRPDIVGRPGGVGHVPHGVVHTAITGAKGGRALVFRVHVKDKPVRYLAEGGSADK